MTAMDWIAVTVLALGCSKRPRDKRPLTVYDERHLVTMQLAADGTITDSKGHEAARLDQDGRTLVIQGHPLSVETCARETAPRAFDLQPARGMSVVHVELSPANEITGQGVVAGQVTGIDDLAAQEHRVAAVLCMWTLIEPPRGTLKVVDGANAVRAQIDPDGTLSDGRGTRWGTYDVDAHQILLGEYKWNDLDVVRHVDRRDLVLHCDVEKTWDAVIDDADRVSVTVHDWSSGATEEHALGTAVGVGKARSEVERFGALLCALQRSTHGQP